MLQENEIFGLGNVNIVTQHFKRETIWMIVRMFSSHSK